ncbi:MAG: DUF4369 domain-containing protein [Bacteroidia bacterium]|nr:DUF4369 domain-containing protein [Bacteroidia bacterium]MBT8276204.1 DUF4369 domain-containing protein [Bacteroidia bacterium]NNF32245.1 DUF4369 domain-containing protein [Flavobacteriaceae bacterium]NNK54346.1 DUF4369 domain-containing protein [Flavobacteriaceae bacterium]NNM07530.1 DUF4369 domain-containing protein [Flavobacteriaceae bacterium]
MRYFGLILGLMIVLTGCSRSENQMQLSGTVKGLKKGTIILQKIKDTVVVSVDSLVVDGDPNFLFTEEINSPEIYYLYLRLENGTLLDDRIPFFAEPSEIKIETSLKKFGNDVSVSGSVNQVKLDTYKQLMRRFNNRNLDVIEQRLKARQDGQDSLAISLSAQQDKILAGKYLATVNYALQQKDFEVAPYLMLSEVYDANLKYLDTVYKVLSPKIKDSKYGEELYSYIEERRKDETN